MSELGPEKLNAEGVDRHGYARCARCGTKRPRAALAQLEVAAGVVRGPGVTVVPILVCADDVAFCSRVAGVGKGTIDGTETGT